MNLVSAWLYPELKNQELHFTPQKYLFNNYSAYRKREISKLFLEKEAKNKVEIPEQELHNFKYELSLLMGWSLLSSKSIKRDAFNVRNGLDELNDPNRLYGYCSGICIFWAIDQIEGTNSFYKLCALLERKSAQQERKELSLAEKQFIETNMQIIIALQGNLKDFKHSFALKNLAVKKNIYVAADNNTESQTEADNWNALLSLKETQHPQTLILTQILEGNYRKNLVSRCVPNEKYVRVTYNYLKPTEHTIEWYDLLKHPEIAESSPEEKLFWSCKDQLEIKFRSREKIVALISLSYASGPSHVVSIVRSESGVFSLFDSNNKSVKRDTNFNVFAERCLKPMFLAYDNKKSTQYTLYTFCKDERH